MRLFSGDICTLANANPAVVQPNQRGVSHDGWLVKRIINEGHGVCSVAGLVIPSWRFKSPSPTTYHEAYISQAPRYIRPLSLAVCPARISQVRSARTGADASCSASNAGRRGQLITSSISVGISASGGQNASQRQPSILVHLTAEPRSHGSQRAMLHLYVEPQHWLLEPRVRNRGTIIETSHLIGE